MPVPGPRTQWRPDPGFRNPGQEMPDFINMWERPGPVWWPGETPGTMIVTLRGCRLAWGQIRHLWRQSINHINAQAPFSWTSNSPTPGRPSLDFPGFFITRALRYMTRSVYVQGGTDNTRMWGERTSISNFNRGKATTVGGGQRQYSPTIRNRLTSFGSRVPTLNEQAVADEQYVAKNQNVGRGSQ